MRAVQHASWETHASSGGAQLRGVAVLPFTAIAYMPTQVSGRFHNVCITAAAPEVVKVFMITDLVLSGPLKQRCYCGPPPFVITGRAPLPLCILP